MKFAGLERRIDERTSLNVFGNRPKTFSDYFEMEFLLSTFPQSDFGYIFRIKDSEHPDRIWNLSYDNNGLDTVSIRINEEGRFSIIKAEFPKASMQARHWTPVRIAFDLQRDSVHLDIAGHSYSTAVEDMPDRFRPEIYFGKSEHIIDVPKFALRDLTVRDKDKNYIFKFDEADGNIAHDTNRHIRAKVENPIWMTKESIDWHHIADMKFKTNAGVVYNPQRKEFYYFDTDRIRIVSTTTEHTTEKKFVSPCPVELFMANCFIGKDGSELYTYELQYEDSDMTRVTIASLNLDTMVWTPLGTSQISSPMHHHISFNTDMGHTIFGGFGKMKYNGRFYCLWNDMEWKEIWNNERSTLYPRYFTSGGIDSAGKYLYIFGGMGNESGEQIVGRHYYYDLHRIELKSGKIEKVWELEWNGINVVPVRNAVISGDYMYTLCYPEHISDSQLSLYRFSIPDGTYEILDDIIPVTSDKILTNANLWYDRDLQKLYASVQVYDDDIKSELKLYSLSFPPIFNHDTGKELHLLTYIACLTAVLILSVASCIIIIRRKRNRQKQSIHSHTMSIKKVFRQTTRPDSIYLFGDFMAFDHNGKDITHLFTTQQRELLCLLLKYNGKEGLSSKKLSNILWPDKEEDKVKNSRGVAINHIRKTLKNIEGIELIFSDGYFRLKYSNQFYCDYEELMVLLAAENPDKDRILDILSNGKFLAFMNNPVFDTFKEKVEESSMPILQKEIESRYNAKEYQAVTEIAEMIFNIDPLDETALSFLIKAMRKMKRVDEALMQYATFAAEYRKVYDSEYGVAFDRI